MKHLESIISEDLKFEIGEVIAVNGREAKGYGTVKAVSYDEPLKAVDENPPNESDGRPFPPHIRLKMNGQRVVGENAGSKAGTFLFHGQDYADRKLRKLSEADFI